VFRGTEVPRFYRNAEGAVAFATSPAASSKCEKRSGVFEIGFCGRQFGIPEPTFPVSALVDHVDAVMGDAAQEALVRHP